MTRCITSPRGRFGLILFILLTVAPFPLASHGATGENHWRPRGATHYCAHSVRQAAGHVPETGVSGETWAKRNRRRLLHQFAQTGQEVLSHEDLTQIRPADLEVALSPSPSDFHEWVALSEVWSNVAGFPDFFLGPQAAPFHALMRRTLDELKVPRGMREPILTRWCLLLEMVRETEFRVGEKPEQGFSSRHAIRYLLLADPEIRSDKPLFDDYWEQMERGLLEGEDDAYRFRPRLVDGAVKFHDLATRRVALLLAPHWNVIYSEVPLREEKARELESLIAFLEHAAVPEPITVPITVPEGVPFVVLGPEVVSAGAEYWQRELLEALYGDRASGVAMTPSSLIGGLAAAQSSFRLTLLEGPRGLPLSLIQAAEALTERKSRTTGDLESVETLALGELPAREAMLNATATSNDRFLQGEAAARTELQRIAHALPVSEELGGVLYYLRQLQERREALLWELTQLHSFGFFPYDDPSLHSLVEELAARLLAGPANPIVARETLSGKNARTLNDFVELLGIWDDRLGVTPWFFFGRQRSLWDRWTRERDRGPEAMQVMHRIASLLRELPALEKQYSEHLEQFAFLHLIRKTLVQLLQTSFGPGGEGLTPQELPPALQEILASQLTPHMLESLSAAVYEASQGEPQMSVGAAMHQVTQTEISAWLEPFLNDKALHKERDRRYRVGPATLVWDFAKRKVYHLVSQKIYFPWQFFDEPVWNPRTRVEELKHHYFGSFVARGRVKSLEGEDSYRREIEAMEGSAKSLHESGVSEDNRLKEDRLLSRLSELYDRTEEDLRAITLFRGVERNAHRLATLAALMQDAPYLRVLVLTRGHRQLRQLQERLLFDMFQPAVGPRPQMTVRQALLGLGIFSASAALAWEEKTYGVGHMVWKAGIKMLKTWVGAE